MQFTKWRELPEFQFYIVSDQGHIAKLIRPRPNIKGYLRFVIKNPQTRLFYLHRAMAENWLDSDVKATVNHKNMNVQDNRICNLEWMTNNENIAHRHTNFINGIRKSINNPLTNKEFIEKSKWKLLNGYDDYIISDHGHVAKLIKPKPNNKGYLRVKFVKDGIRVDRYVHRIIASVWISNEYSKHCVNHKNFNVQDNSAVNLEWVTNHENQTHSWKYNKTRKKKDNTGEKNPRAKLSESDIIEIRKRYDNNERPIDFYKTYNVSHSLIIQIGKRQIWTHIKDETTPIKPIFKNRGAVGVVNKKSKLKDEQVYEIRTRYDRGESESVISKDYPVSLLTITRIVNRLSWAHLS
jgi:hypothetical protein